MEALKKFTSRKWLIAVGGVVFGVFIALGYAVPEDLLAKATDQMKGIVALAQTIAGAITAVLSVLSYNKAESKIDEARAANGK